MLCSSSCPNISRPSQEGFWRHFDAVARAVDIPILVHNPAARTAVVLAPATMARLAEIPAIIGIVDDDSTPLRRQAIQDVSGSSFDQFCGSDDQMAAAASMGASGCLSSLANVSPGLCVTLDRACTIRDFETAFAIQAKLNRLRTNIGSFDDTAV